ncbi:hypothetical protein PIB30_106367, partial [Stylosanthes scabra]|nr:hypothetical protein [Stylosanthes scabra]
MKVVVVISIAASEVAVVIATSYSDFSIVSLSKLRHHLTAGCCPPVFQRFVVPLLHIAMT